MHDAYSRTRGITSVPLLPTIAKLTSRHQYVVTDNFAHPAATVIASPHAVVRVNEPPLDPTYFGSKSHCCEKIWLKIGGAQKRLNHALSREAV